MAAEDESIAAELDEQLRVDRARAWRELEEERLFSGRVRRRRRGGHGATRRRRHRLAGLGRDAAAHVAALGRAARVRGRDERGLARGGGRASSRPRSSPAARTPTACSRPRRACTGWCASRRSTPQSPPPHALRAGRGGPLVEDDVDVEIDDDDLQIDTYRAIGRRRPAREQDRLGGADHAHADQIVVQCQNERSQSSNKDDGDEDAAGRSWSSWRSASAQEEIAREKGEAQDVAWGSQIRSLRAAPLHDGQGPPHRTYEMGDAQRVLDGDLDGFVRAELLRRAGNGAVAG